MELNLKYPPTPEAAPQHAALVVQTARKVSGVTLDYSVQSLAAVDEILDGWHQESVPAEQVAAILFAFGGYVGEVFVRHAGARWVSAEGTAMDDFAGFFIVLEVGPKNLVNPIGKVFKRLENGIEDNLPYFYRVFAHPHGAPVPETPPPPRSFFTRLFGRLK